MRYLNGTWASIERAQLAEPIRQRRKPAQLDHCRGDRLLALDGPGPLAMDRWKNPTSHRQGAFRLHTELFAGLRK